MIRFRRFAIVAAALGLFAAACQLVAGIDDHHFTAASDVEIPDAIVTDAIFLGTTCNETPVPAPPIASAPSDDAGAQLIFAWDSITLPDIHHPYGFDLDGVCTCQKGDPSTHSGQNSCALPLDSNLDGGCDFDAGVDNSFARLVSLLESLPTGDGPLQDEDKNIYCGASNVLLVIDGYNHTANDEQVLISALRSPGIFTVPNPDGGSPVDASICNVTGCDHKEGEQASPPYPFPSLGDGNDVWSLSPLDLANYQANSAVNQIGGYVKDGVLVVNAVGSQVNLPIAYEAQRFSISTPILTAKIGQDATGRWRLTGGVISGRTNANDIVSGLWNAFSDGSGNCDGGFVFPLLEDEVCSVRDIPSNVAQDFAIADGGLVTCDGISVGIEFTAVSAHINSIENDSGSTPCNTPPPPCGAH